METFLNQFFKGQVQLSTVQLLVLLVASIAITNLVTQYYISSTVHAPSVQLASPQYPGSARRWKDTPDTDGKVY
jgi:hypothetical protein